MNILGAKKILITNKAKHYKITSQAKAFPIPSDAPVTTKAEFGSQHTHTVVNKICSQVKPVSKHIWSRTSLFYSPDYILYSVEDKGNPVLIYEQFLRT